VATHSRSASNAREVPMLKILLLALLALASATDMPTPEGLSHPEPGMASSAALQG
jgi:hypothetical protein